MTTYSCLQRSSCSPCPFSSIAAAGHHQESTTSNSTTTTDADSSSPASSSSSAQQQQPLHLILLGAPGAGKGTQTDALLRKFSLQSLVVGNLLRAEVTKKSNVGIKAAKVMKEGGLLDDATILDVVKPGLKQLNGKDWILVSSSNDLLLLFSLPSITISNLHFRLNENQPRSTTRRPTCCGIPQISTHDEKKGYDKLTVILTVSPAQDGYPRTSQQAHDLADALSQWGESINLVVNLDVPDEVLIERIENRWVHLPSGRVYNTTYNPPKVEGIDDVTGDKLIKRMDDRVDVFQRRLDKFHKENEPIKTFYKERGTLVSLYGRTR